MADEKDPIDWQYVGAAKLSTRGQLVLPEKVREALKLRPGVFFKVEFCEKGDTGETQIVLTPLK